MLKLESGFDLKFLGIQRDSADNLSARRHAVQLATFYVAVPIMLGLLAAWNGSSGLASSFSKPIAVVFWCLFYLWLWWLMAFSTSVTKRILRPWALNDFIVLFIGGVTGGVLARPIYSVYQGYFYSHFLPAGVPYTAWSPFPASMQEMGYVLMQAAFSASVWVVAHLFWRGVTAAERRRDPASAVTAETSPVATTPTVDALPRFARGLGIISVNDIMAVQAQDHYLRVLTRTGEKMLLYRFRDALDDLVDVPGLKVHRSYWVRLGAIAALTDKDSSYEIGLNNGTTVPVHKKYAESVKTAFSLMKRG